MKPSDLWIPAILVGCVIFGVAGFIFYRLRKFIFQQPEDRDKIKIKAVREQRAEFVQSRSVEKGIQDHKYFDLKIQNEENERFKGTNNMFWVNTDPLAKASMLSGASSQPENALALIFAFASLDGSTATDKEAEKVKNVFLKHGYRVCVFSHGANTAPPSSRSIATTLKHLLFSKRNWQNVVVYVCGSARSVQVPSVGALNLESETGKKLANGERIVPVMWELLAEYEERARNSNWIDLTTLLFRVRQSVRTPQPVVVFLDISIAPSAVSNIESKNEQTSSTAASLVRASAELASESGRDQLIQIIPSSLLSQLEIVFCKRDSFNASVSGGGNNNSNQQQSRFNVLFGRACANARLDSQMNAGGSGGIAGQFGLLAGAASSAFRLDYPDTGVSVSAYRCGELTPASIVAFIHEHTAKISSSEENKNTNNTKSFLHHISPLVNSVQLAVTPVYGPRSGLRPERTLTSTAYQQTEERTAKLWNAIFDNVTTNLDKNENVIPAPPICLRGFATSTTLRHLIWSEECLRFFPDAVAYVDAAAYSPRRPPFKNFNTAFDQMWKSLLQVVCNSFVSFNRTWDSVESCVECLRAGLLATDFSTNSASEESNDAILLVFDNIPLYQKRETDGNNNIINISSMIHPALLAMVKQLAEKHSITVQIVVGYSDSSRVPTSLAYQHYGHVTWMSNTVPLAKKDVESINKKYADVGMSNTPVKYLLSEENGDLSAENVSATIGDNNNKSAWEISLSSKNVIDNLEISHRHLLQLIEWMQRDLNDSPVPIESVAHYAKIHCSRSIADVVRAAGMSLLAQEGLVCRTTLSQPRGCETECVFVNPCIRGQLAKLSDGDSSSSLNENNNNNVKEENEQDASSSSSLITKHPNRYNPEVPVLTLHLPNIKKNPLEAHIWRVHTCFAVVPELRDPRLMYLASGMTLYSETIRPYFPKFLISLAYYAAASPEIIRLCVPMSHRRDFEELSLAPKHCYILLREFLQAPMVLGDMISTMGVTATADTLDSCSAITAGHVSTSAPLFGCPDLPKNNSNNADNNNNNKNAETKLITALRTIPDFLDNQPFEWTFQFCHRGIRGHYNSLMDRESFVRVPLPKQTENSQDDDEKFDAKNLSGVVVPTLTRISDLRDMLKRYNNADDDANNNKTKKQHNKKNNKPKKYVNDDDDDSNDDENKKKKSEKKVESDEDENAVNTTSNVTYSDALDFSHLLDSKEPKFIFENKKYATCLEYAPLNVSNTDSIRGCLVVGFSDGSIAIYKMFPDFEQSILTTNHVLPIDTENPLFEAESSEAHEGTPITNILFEVIRKEETHGEAKIVKTHTKIITASRSNGKIIKWDSNLANKESIPKLAHGDKNITKCSTPIQPIVIRNSVDPARLALDRIGITHSSSRLNDIFSASNNNNNGAASSTTTTVGEEVFTKDHRRNTIASLETGGETVLLVCGQEQDGERNGAMIALTEVRQCVMSMTFDATAYTRESMPEKGVITTAGCGVDPFNRAIVVAVADRSGRLMQFELRVVHMEAAEDVLDKDEARRDARRSQRKKQKELEEKKKKEMEEEEKARKLKAAENSNKKSDEKEGDDDEEEEDEEDFEEEEEADEAQPENKAEDQVEEKKIADDSVVEDEDQKKEVQEEL